MSRTIYVCIVVSGMVACAAPLARRQSSLDDPSNPNAQESSARAPSRTLVPEETSQHEVSPLKPGAPEHHHSTPELDNSGTAPGGSHPSPQKSKREHEHQGTRGDSHRAHATPSDAPPAGRRP